MIKEIPVITTEYFDEVYIEHILELYRYSDKSELEEKVSGKNDSNLNKRAERYIDTYLMNRGKDVLTEDNWKACKELYILWKLFEEIELEEVSADKKDSLMELLELFKTKIINEDVNKNSKVRGLEVY